MKTPAETIIGWKISPEAHPRAVLFRTLVEFDSWMPPINDDFPGDTFGTFEEAMLPLKAHEGLRLHPLCSCWDASEAYTAKEGASGFGDRGGWEMFGTPWEDAQALWIDPGTPQEMVIGAEDFPKLKALAEAVAVERAWQRLRKGNENPGDLALVAHYGSYHLGVAKRDEENFCFCEVANDDGRAFIALFTHADALAPGWAEIAQRYAGQDAKQACVSGPQIFPTLANEPTAGFVINYNGPTEPAVFSREVFDLLVAEINKPEPGPSASPSIPQGPPPLPGAPKSSGPPPFPKAAPDFNRLSAIANDAGASMSDNDALFGAAFRLPEWHFIARGELPKVRPYVAANPTIVSGAPMVKAFTDTKRLHAFAKENGLTGPEGEVHILSLPVAGLLPTMADLGDQGVTHIHFNADQGSQGFYVPLVQLPIIRQHLEKQGLL